MSRLDIITCPQWGARKSRGTIRTCKAPIRVIFHHTAGHHAEISNPSDESLAEAMRYARDIQNYHMDHNGWIDSGHNFLVTRGGRVLQGRWLTVSAIQAGHMVVSAHCPGQNGQIGVEHEHKGNEPMTNAQREASALLMAWFGKQYGRKLPLPMAPHRKYYATACPANLADEIPTIARLAAQYLREGQV